MPCVPCTTPPGFDPCAPLDDPSSPPPSPPGGAATPLSTALNALQALTVDTSRIDAAVPVTTLLSSPTSTSFSMFQVEQLLSQCASLLERGIASQSEYQALGEKSFATWLELSEFAELEAIHAEEINAGYYRNTAIASANELIAQQALAAQSNQASTDLSPFAELPNGVGTIQAISTLAQQRIYQGDSAAANARISTGTVQSQYDNCDQWFKRRRTEAARRNNYAKLAAYTTPGGAYNYEDRRAVLKSRFVEDFTDALSRINAIEAGLKAIYGIPWTMKTLLNTVINETTGTTLSSFDAALLAVRAALEALSQFGIKEQNYILPISLKTLMGSADWAAGFSADKETGIWDLFIGNHLFPNQAHVRLRGVSATVNVADTVGLYQAAFSVPTQGEVTFADGTIQTPLDQSTIPMTRIGRVRAANFQHPPDIVGTLSLVNASPIGHQGAPGSYLEPWRFGITSSLVPLNEGQLSSGTAALVTAQPTATQPIDDVTLYLYLAIRSI